MLRASRPAGAILPTFEQLSSALIVDGGSLVWRRTVSPSARAGGVVSSLDRGGYARLKFMNCSLLAHRVVWILTYGCWPNSMLDHIDGNRTNNHPSNLRECNSSQNQMNRRPYPGRLKGVTLHKQTGKYQALIAHCYIGLFDSPIEAARAYDAEAIKRFGEFARINGAAT